MKSILFGLLIGYAFREIREAWQIVGIDLIIPSQIRSIPTPIAVLCAALIMVALIILSFIMGRIGRTEDYPDVIDGEWRRIEDKEWIDAADWRKAEDNGGSNVGSD